MRIDISSSQLISRSCLASYTAHGLLFDQPRAPRIRGWLGVFISCILIGPVRTSAYSDLSTQLIAPTDPAPRAVAQNTPRVLHNLNDEN